MAVIKKWMLKVIVQKTISFLPYKNKINYLFQKYITKGVKLTDLHFNDKLTAAKDHINYLRIYGEINKATCFELGTGWYPVVPLSLYLCGANYIFSIDVSTHLNKASLLKTMEKIFEWNSFEKIDKYLGTVDKERWEQINFLYENHQQFSLKELLLKLKISIIVDDARNMNLSENSIDFICSNNTFEHIYPGILKDILLEFKRILKPEGLMSHFIDMSDHFAHFDKSISIYNFLQFTEKQWQWIDNSIQPQNRLRFCQYRTMYQQLEIPFETALVRPGNLDAVTKINIKAPFNTFTSEELAISHGYIRTNFLN